MNNIPEYIGRYAYILERMTGDEVRIRFSESKWYVERWTGTLWVKA